MNEITNAFKPNRVISGRTTGIVAVAWAGLFLLWWATFPPKIVPGPLGVLESLAELFKTGGFLEDLLTSITLNIEAIAISTAISLVLSYLTVLPGLRPVVALISKLRFLGLTGLTFVFGLSLSGHALKVGILVFGLTVFFVTSMASVIASIPKEKFDYARTLRMSEWEVVWHVVIRGTRDQAFEVLRQNAAIGWMMLTMVEGLVRMEGGVGVVLLNENRHFRLEAVFAVQLTILIVGLVQDYGIGALKNMLCPYANLKLERK